MKLLHAIIMRSMSYNNLWWFPCHVWRNHCGPLDRLF